MVESNDIFSLYVVHPPDVDPLGDGDCPLSLIRAAAPGTFPAAENIGRYMEEEDDEPPPPP